MLFVCLHINIYLRDFSVISADQSALIHSALRVAWRTSLSACVLVQLSCNFTRCSILLFADTLFCLV